LTKEEQIVRDYKERRAAYIVASKKTKSEVKEIMLLSNLAKF